MNNARTFLSSNFSKYFNINSLNQLVLKFQKVHQFENFFYDDFPYQFFNQFICYILIVNKYVLLKIERFESS